MSKIKINELLSRLEEQTVFSVTIGLYLFHLVCESGDRISVYSPFQIGLVADTAKGSVEYFPISNTDLPSVIGKKIVKTSIVDGLVTYLEFSEGIFVRIFRNSPESYAIKIGNLEYIIKETVSDIESVIMSP